MRLVSIFGVVGLTLVTQACVAESGGEVYADGPTPPRDYLCADGREVSYVAMMGGFVNLTIGDRVIAMEQVADTTLDGYVHVGGSLVWITHLQDMAEIADLAPGQSVDDVQRIPCTRVAR